MSKQIDESAAWMRRLQAGDELALDALIKRWQGPLVAYALRLTGRREEALDLVQETFVRLYKSRARYQPRARFSSWLFTIAANLCRNQARWRARHPTLAWSDLSPALEEDAPALIDGEPSPADAAARKELAGAVREQVDALPGDLKTAVWLFNYEELSQAQIARLLGCSVKAVETRLYRARKLLRESLAGWRAER